MNSTSKSNTPGEINKFADVLSRIYSDKPKGVVCTESELVDEVVSHKRIVRQRCPPSLKIN